MIYSLFLTLGWNAGLLPFLHTWLSFLGLFLYPGYTVSSIQHWILVWNIFFIYQRSFICFEWWVLGSFAWLGYMWLLSRIWSECFCANTVLMVGKHSVHPLHVSTVTSRTVNRYHDSLVTKCGWDGTRFLQLGLRGTKVHDLRRIVTSRQLDGWDWSFLG